jgi:hypothetical protein
MCQKRCLLATSERFGLCANQTISLPVPKSLIRRRRISFQRRPGAVDALPDTEVQAAISLLAELGEQEIVDAETAAKLDLARAEPGDDVPLEEVRRRLGL